VGGLLRAIENYSGSEVVGLALQDSAKFSR
jgi:hypothetical protein